MDCILGSIGSEKGSDRIGGFLLRLLGIGGSDESSPLLDGIWGDKLHSNDDIAGNELLQIREEGLADVLAVENLGGLLGELGHFQFIDCETFLLDCIDDLAHVLIRARFDHGKRALAVVGLLGLRCNIGIANDGEHPAKDGDLGSNEQIGQLDTGHLYSLEEDLSDFYVEHFDGVVDGEVEEAVAADDVGLGVVPLGLENVPLVLDGFGERHLNLNKL